MYTLLLGGYGNGDWMPLLGMLIIMGCIVQFIDWSIKYIKRYRRRKLAELQQSIHDEYRNDSATKDFSSN